MSGTPTRDTLGAWLLKANPRVWDLRGFLASPDPVIRSWAVRPGSRATLMTPGDRVLLWLSGDGRSGFDRGIWGLGRITHPAEPWHDGERGFWVDHQAREAVRARVRLELPLLRDAVTARELRSYGISLEVQRMPAGPNPSWVSREELDRLEDLLPPWPPDPSSAPVPVVEQQSGAADLVGGGGHDPIAARGSGTGTLGP